MKVDNLILSVSLHNDTYYRLFPLVAAAWKKFFPGIKINLAIVPDGKLYIAELLQKYCDEIYFFEQLSYNIPIENIAKISRLYYSTFFRFNDKVITINDVDMIPLQKDLFQGFLDQRKPNQLMCPGRNFYSGTAHQGKFPMHYFTGEGKLFKQVINPKDIGWKSFVLSFLNYTHIDGKEDITKPFKIFSDESLIRSLIRRNKGDIDIIYPDKHIQVGINSVYRGEPINTTKLYNGELLEAHHLIPVEKHIDKVMEIAKYIGYPYDPEWCDK